MRKTFCDICGEDTKNKTSIPDFYVKITGYPTQDLCLDCRGDIIDFIKELKKEHETKS